MPKHVIAVLIGLTLIAGCGGGGGGGGTSTGTASSFATTSLASSPAQNVLPISVNFGPTSAVNMLQTSVTVCEPGSISACQTVDNILIDTGSTGLRIVAPLLSGVSLPRQLDAEGSPVAECAQFAGGSTWGSVRLADVRIGGKQALSLPIQAIGDPASMPVPASCLSTGRSLLTVQALGVNGYLGVGAFRHDCGVACVQSASAGFYYACPPSGCQLAPMPLAKQVSNPVSMFADDNNGVLIQLPSVPETGSASADGLLVFGIGTQKNNALGKASVFTLNAFTGGVTTYFNGNVLNNSYIDTGSNALYLKDASIPACASGALGAGYDCPASTQTYSATIQGANGTNANVTFSVANAATLIASGAAAFSNLAAPITWTSSVLPNFDWGLPFFFGRNVFLAFEGASVAGAPTGPFIAF